MIETLPTTDMPQVDVIGTNSPFFPQLLKQTIFPEEVFVGGKLVPLNTDPPQRLFTTGPQRTFDLIGNGEVHSPIAICGTYEASHLGKRVAAAFASTIAEMGHNHIGRLNEGIDGYASLGAIKNGGHSFSVLPRAIEKVYPPQAAQVKSRLDGSATFVSEHSLTDDPFTAGPIYNQRLRDQDCIVAGSAEVLIIVEGRLNSSEHRLMEIALSIGRPVIVVIPKYNIPGHLSANRQLSELVTTDIEYSDNPLIHTIEVNAWTDSGPGDLRFGQDVDLRQTLMQIRQQSE